MLPGPRVAWIVGAIVVLLAGGAAVVVLLGGDEVEVAGTTTTTTTTMVPGGPVAPLTGVPVPPDDAGRLARPALAVKVDNDPAAAPQRGLGAADLVVELRVEGISRFLAVFHSRDVAEVGPTRSARTSDPDVLAMLGRPLFAWSGGNPAVAEAIRSSPWVQDIGVDRLPDAYARDRERRRPHDLMFEPAAGFAAADEPPTPPAPVFSYASPEATRGGIPVPGVAVSVGRSQSTYRWDADRGGWERDAPRGGPVDGSGRPLAPANLVVLETEYRPSSADRASPEAITVGTGTAWVFTAGQLVQGRWDRPDRTLGWALSGPDGAPIALSPGPSWIALVAPGAPPQVLPAEEAGAPPA